MCHRMERLDRARAASPARAQQAQQAQRGAGHSRVVAAWRVPCGGRRQTLPHRQRCVERGEQRSQLAHGVVAHVPDADRPRGERSIARAHLEAALAQQRDEERGIAVDLDARNGRRGGSASAFCDAASTMPMPPASMFTSAPPTDDTASTRRSTSSRLATTRPYNATSAIAPVDVSTWTSRRGRRSPYRSRRAHAHPRERPRYARIARRTRPRRARERGSARRSGNPEPCAYTIRPHTTSSVVTIRTSCFFHSATSPATSASTIGFVASSTR